MMCYLVYEHVAFIITETDRAITLPCALQRQTLAAIQQFFDPASATGKCTMCSSKEHLSVMCYKNPARMERNLPCELCELDHPTDKCRLMPPICFRCGQRGHEVGACTEPERKNASGGDDRQLSGELRYMESSCSKPGKLRGKCFTCQQPGHQMSKCPLKKLSSKRISAVACASAEGHAVTSPVNAAVPASLANSADNQQKLHEVGFIATLNPSIVPLIGCTM